MRIINQALSVGILTVLASTALAQFPLTRLTAATKPVHPRPQTLSLANQSSHLGPVSLDAYDYVQVTLPAADFAITRLGYNEYTQMKFQEEPESVDDGDIIYVWAEDLVFDRWGAPGSQLAQWNGYQFEKSNLVFLAQRDETYGGVRVGLKNKEIKSLYNPNADPAELDLADGDPVDTYYYVAKKSDCSNEGGSVLCAPRRVKEATSVGFVRPGLTQFSKDPEVHVLRYSQDPEKGNPLPDEILDATDIEFNKDKSEVLKVKIKLN